MGSSDMYGLVESWVWGRSESNGGGVTPKAPEAEWCELAVLTGDGRHLLGQGKCSMLRLFACTLIRQNAQAERALMEELVTMVPTLCHPEDLGSLLSLACGFDFYAPDTGRSESTQPLQSKGDFSTRRLLDLLHTISGDGATASRAHRKLRKSGVRSFLQWRSANLERSRRDSTVLRSRLAESSNAATYSGDLPPSASPKQRRSSESPSTELRPVPTLARARASNEGHPKDWEAGLSRRAALRRETTAERMPKPESKPDPPPTKDTPSPEKRKPQEGSGFFDDRCVGRGYSSRSGLGVNEGLRAGWSIAKALVYPLRLAQTVMFPETLASGKGMGAWGWLKVACIGAVVGLGLYLAKQ